MTAQDIVFKHEVKAPASASVLLAELNKITPGARSRLAPKGNIYPRASADRRFLRPLKPLYLCIRTGIVTTDAPRRRRITRAVNLRRLKEWKSMATMTALRPGSCGFPVSIQPRYDNFIGGEWVAPSSGKYFDNVTL